MGQCCMLRSILEAWPRATCLYLHAFMLAGLRNDDDAVGGDCQRSMRRLRPTAPTPNHPSTPPFLLPASSSSTHTNIRTSHHLSPLLPSSIPLFLLSIYRSLSIPNQKLTPQQWPLFLLLNFPKHVQRHPFPLPDTRQLLSWRRAHPHALGLTA